jgi:hypothetical protein
MALDSSDLFNRISFIRGGCCCSFVTFRVTQRCQPIFVVSILFFFFFLFLRKKDFYVDGTFCGSRIKHGSYVVDGVLMGDKSLISNEEQILKKFTRF